jgi:hypothetical protein
LLNFIENSFDGAFNCGLNKLLEPDGPATRVGTYLSEYFGDFHGIKPEHLPAIIIDLIDLAIQM